MRIRLTMKEKAGNILPHVGFTFPFTFLIDNQRTFILIYLTF